MIFLVVLVILLVIFYLLVNLENMDDYIKENKIKVHPFSEFEEGCKTGDLVLMTNSHPISKWIRNVCEVPFSHVLLVIREKNNIGLFEVNQGTKVRLVPFLQAFSSSDVSILGWKRLIGSVSTSSFLEVMGRTKEKEYKGKLIPCCLAPFLEKRLTDRIMGTKTYWCTQLIIEALVGAGIIEGEKSTGFYSLNHFFHGRFKFKQGFGYEETCFVRY